MGQVILQPVVGVLSGVFSIMFIFTLLALILGIEDSRYKLKWLHDEAKGFFKGMVFADVIVLVMIGIVVFFEHFVFIA